MLVLARGEWRGCILSSHIWSPSAGNPLERGSPMGWRGHNYAEYVLCCSMFVVCHQRFQCGAEQRRPGGGGGGIGGGVCRWSLRLCRGAVIKLVKCPTSGHFVLITGYNGHHHTLTWSGYTRLGPLLYSVHFPGYMTHDQTCKQCLRMFESQYFSNLCQSLLTIC